MALIQKILDLRNLKISQVELMENKFLEKLYKDLESINFFTDGERPSFEYDTEVFHILKLAPNPEDKFDGNNYIKKDYLKQEKLIQSKIYNFSLRVCSTCG